MKHDGSILGGTFSWPNNELTAIGFHCATYLKWSCTTWQVGKNSKATSNLQNSTQAGGACNLEEVVFTM